ncbi:hypothetical protein UCD39_20930 [Nitrospirillum sp. BR 11752]|uniref:hypothetical protein n=1 Tax=Nitrospirillum sp. BR 11752 TaxID=3104293 RepID=UPI002EADB71C|nr:hypothetical protein [Nitrospirillum sp. BR 11752]
MIVAEGGSAAAGGTGVAADKKTQDKKTEDQKTDSEFAALLKGGKMTRRRRWRKSPLGVCRAIGLGGSRN